MTLVFTVILDVSCRVFRSKGYLPTIESCIRHGSGRGERGIGEFTWAEQRAWGQRTRSRSERGGRLLYISILAWDGLSGDIHSSTQSSLALPSLSIWPVTRSTHSS